MKRFWRSHSVVLGLALALTASAFRPAHAEEDAIQPHPSFAGPSGLILVPTASTLDQFKFSLGAIADMRIQDANLRDTISHVNELRVVAAVGLLDWLEVSARLPFVWNANREQLGDPNGEHKGIGDVAASAKVAILKDGKLLGDGDKIAPINVAALVTYRFGATGRVDYRDNIDSLIGGEGLERDVISVGGLVDLPIDLGRKGEYVFQGPILLTAGLAGNFVLGSQTGAGPAEKVDSTLSYHGGIELPIYGNYYLPGEKFALEGVVHGETNDLSNADDDPLSVFAGARYGVGNGIGIAGGVDFGISKAVDDYRGIVALSYAGPVARPVVEAAAAAAPVEKIVERVVEKERFILPDVNFAFDKHSLTPLGTGKVYLLAQYIKGKKVKSVEIDGHCDERGSDAYNDKLGTRRADTVKAALIKFGVPASVLSTKSYGEKSPLIPAKGEWAWSVNRRVEVVITPEGGEPSRGLPGVTAPIPAPHP
ncbi:MAG: OmpA family protein [bacterium]